MEIYSEEELQRFEAKLAAEEAKLGQQAEHLRQQHQELQQRQEELDAQKKDLQQVRSVRLDNVWLQGYNSILSRYKIHEKVESWAGTAHS